MPASILCLMATLLQPAQGEAESQIPPFKFELPAGYQAFEMNPVANGEWHSFRQDRDATFTIAHLVISEPGAVSELVAADLRRRKWAPLLANIPHQILPWSGSWAALDASGSRIFFTQESRKRAALEKVVAQFDSLLIGSWEGPLDQLELAEQALASFRPPPSWHSAPPIDFDSSKGLGPSSKPNPAIGFFDLLVEFPQGASGNVAVEIAFTASDLFSAEQKKLKWEIPGGETRELELIDGKCQFKYELDLLPPLADTAGSNESLFGIWHSGLSAALLEPTWLALPVNADLEGFTSSLSTPPAWRLRVRTLGADYAISSAAAETIEVEAGTASRLFTFSKQTEGLSWPFLMVGSFNLREKWHYPLWLRAGAGAIRAGETLKFMTSLEHSLRDWLPASRFDWQVATFPSCGSRMLPGLWLLDEDDDWLQAPLDASFGRADYFTAMAEFAGARLFGLQLRGAGSAASFMEVSLAEYAAMRLLHASQHHIQADRLESLWRNHDQQSGDLLKPLSLITRMDLEGPRRLLSRGPLVWLAIEHKAGRDKLDAVLNAAIRTRSWWTTEDLREALENRTDQDWSTFFRDYVYGRDFPPTISKQ